MRLSTTALTALLSVSSLLWIAAPAAAQSNRGTWPPPRASMAEVLADCVTEKPDELFLLERVIDGDTIWIQRNGEREKLRLLAVDTEEKYMGPKDISASKPSTRFGEQSTGWAKGFFLPRTPDEPPLKVGLRFPGGSEARDVYGRLLCHVVTSEGIDFNLLLVRMGHSPYFNKYGNSRIAHKAFVAAQIVAQKEKRGIWDDRTNDGGKKRDYVRLAAWWQLRADAIDTFRAKSRKEPLLFVAADEPEALQRALDGGPNEVVVFAIVDRFYEEDDGSRTVLLRSGDKKRAVRVPIPADMREAMRAVDLDGSLGDFRQNYFFVTGKLVQGRRGFDLLGVTVSDWRLAGARPALATDGR